MVTGEGAVRQKEFLVLVLFLAKWGLNPLTDIYTPILYILFIYFCRPKEESLACLTLGAINGAMANTWYEVEVRVNRSGSVGVPE